MSGKRWIKRVLAGLLAVGPTGGCKQQLFLDPADYRDAVMSTLPREIENRPHDAIFPAQVDRLSGAATVLDATRPGRMITLKECIAIAMEQGNTGNLSPNNPGLKVDNPERQIGQSLGGSDAIRAFAIDPAVAAVELERSLSKFDVRWVSSMTWQKVDQPTPAQFLSFQNARDVARLDSTLFKPLPTGGTAGITFSTDYSNFNQIPPSQQQAFVNPNYTPRVQFTFEQPLARLFGVEANLLSPQHPGSLLLGLQPPGGQGTEGILISRIRLDQRKADFDVLINFLLLNVETAYWNLYAAYYNLYAQEEGLRQAFEGYRFNDIRFQVGNDPQQNVEQARAQFERFRRLVLQARGQVLEAERNLRGLMGLRSDDGTRLVPIDQPAEAAYRPDFYESANEAIANRPELVQARQALKANQLNLLLQKNLRRPDVRLIGQYDVAGLGTRLDGSETLPNGNPGNALASLTSNQFNSWTIGFRADVPIGFRDANGLVRAAELNLARSFYQLRDGEMKSLEYLVLQYRRVIQAHAEIAPARAERKALQVASGLIKEKIEIGNWTPQDYQQSLNVQRDLATAISNEFRAIADYNSALSALEFAKGTIQRYNNVSVGEGPLPPWVQKRAADQIRERTEAAIKLREREILPPPAGPAAVGGTRVGPPVGTAVIGDLPPFALPREPLPEGLPDPRPAPGKDGTGKPEPKMMPAAPGGLGVGNTGGSPRPLPVVPPASPPPSDATPAGDYFEPAGTVTLPPRGTRGPAGSPVPDPGAPPVGSALPVPLPPVGQ